MTVPLPMPRRASTTSTATFLSEGFWKPAVHHDDARARRRGAPDPVARHDGRRDAREQERLVPTSEAWWRAGSTQHWPAARHHSRAKEHRSFVGCPPRRRAVIAAASCPRHLIVGSPTHDRHARSSPVRASRRDATARRRSPPRREQRSSDAAPWAPPERRSRTAARRSRRICKEIRIECRKRAVASRADSAATAGAASTTARAGSVNSAPRTARACPRRSPPFRAARHRAPNRFPRNSRHAARAGWRREHRLDRVLFCRGFASELPTNTIGARRYPDRARPLRDHVDIVIGARQSCPRAQQAESPPAFATPGSPARDRDAAAQSARAAAERAVAGASRSAPSPAGMGRSRRDVTRAPIASLERATVEVGRRSGTSSLSRRSSRCAARRS